ncbi:MAG: esterase, partial [Chloroflexota bacterium]
DCAFELCYLPDFAKVVTEVGRHPNLSAWMDSFWKALDKGNKGVTVMNVLAMAAAYSPNMRVRPLRADMPFDLRTAELKPDVWERWLAHDPVRLAAGHAAALRGLKLFYIDAGTRDEFHLHLGARILIKRLRALEVKFHHEEFDAGHFNISYRYDVSFPRLWRALKG